MTRIYFQDIVILFYGGLVMAKSIELSGLHERISLKILLLFGSNPKWLMLGFMSITAFMSLWISNSAACSMMLPMITAVVNQLVLNDDQYLDKGHDNLALEEDVETKSETKSNEDIFKNSKRARNLSTGKLKNKICVKATF